MDKEFKNNDTPLRLNNEELIFPITFRLKAVLTTGIPDKENKKQLTDIFENLRIASVFYGKNKSSKGNYVSYTYEITVLDHQTMRRLYSRLKEIDNLKFAL